MMHSGGTDAMHCKLFMSTLSGTSLDWFVSLPPVSYDLFDVRQYQEESLKDFLNRLGAQVVKLHTKDEDMTVHSFRKGMLPGPFSDSDQMPP